MRKLIIAALAAASLSTQASLFTGNDLLERIRDESHVKQGHALGYIAGVHDATQGDYQCVSEGVRLGQLRDVVRQYLERRPETRHLSAALLVTMALQEKWPCKQSLQPGGKG